MKTFLAAVLLSVVALPASAQVTCNEQHVTTGNSQEYVRCTSKHNAWRTVEAASFSANASNGLYKDQQRPGTDQIPMWAVTGSIKMLTQTGVPLKEAEILVINAAIHGIARAKPDGSVCLDGPGGEIAFRAYENDYWGREPISVSKVCN
jgi:hypothetical protein